MSKWPAINWPCRYGKVNLNVSCNPLPTLPQLRNRLAIPPINTGRQIYPLGRAGLVTDDLEGLHAITDEHGRMQLISGVENSTHAYRGQTREHTPCLPLLGRLKTHEEQLLTLCRNIAFEDAISDHPFVRMAEQSTFLGHPLFVDKEGLAQHYNLPTHLLDMTDNFEVASFFATCARNSDTRQYEPATDTQQHGVIYRLTPVFMIDPAIPDRAFGPFHIIGWQPLPRPEQQRAFAVEMKPGQNFCELPSVERFPFRHRARVSHRIWKSFDEGRALFPPDAADELATQANTLHQFTRPQIDRAWKRLGNWLGETFNTEVRKIIENRGNITETTAPILTWNGLDIETDEDRLSQKLAEILSRVRYRMAAYVDT